MKIEGIGNVRKADIMKEMLSPEGRGMVRRGEVTNDELAAEYKRWLVSKASKFGRYPDTFNACWDNIPAGVRESATVADLAELVDNFYYSRPHGYDE